jgi:hypothetical protein
MAGPAGLRPGHGSGDSQPPSFGRPKIFPDEFGQAIIH